MDMTEEALWRERKEEIEVESLDDNDNFVPAKEVEESPIEECVVKIVL